MRNARFPLELWLSGCNALFARPDDLLLARAAARQVPLVPLGSTPGAELFGRNDMALCVHEAGAVSYTHLVPAAGHGKLLAPPAGGLQPAVGKLTHGAVEHHMVPAVSYTHLDVYKRQAKRYVYIFTPYLIIDDLMKEALCAAAKRGVDCLLYTSRCV